MRFRLKKHLFCLLLIVLLTLGLVPASVHASEFSHSYLKQLTIETLKDPRKLSTLMVLAKQALIEVEETHHIKDWTRQTFEEIRFVPDGLSIKLRGVQHRLLVTTLDLSHPKEGFSSERLFLGTLRSGKKAFLHAAVYGDGFKETVKEASQIVDEAEAHIQRGAYLAALEKFGSGNKQHPIILKARARFIKLLEEDREAIETLMNQMKIERKRALHRAPFSRYVNLLDPALRHHRIFTRKGGRLPSTKQASQIVAEAQKLIEKQQYWAALQKLGSRNEQHPLILEVRDRLFHTLEQDYEAAEVLVDQMKIQTSQQLRKAPWSGYQRRLSPIFSKHKIFAANKSIGRHGPLLSPKEASQIVAEAEALIEEKQYWAALKKLGTRTKLSPDMQKMRTLLIQILMSSKQETAILIKQMGITRREQLRQKGLWGFHDLLKDILTHHGIFTHNKGGRTRNGYPSRRTTRSRLKSRPIIPSGHLLYKNLSRTLRADEEAQIEQWRQMRNGDETARVRLIESLLFFIVETVESTRAAAASKSYDKEELVQAANIHVLQKIDQWDETAWRKNQGPSLHTYLQTLIFQTVQEVNRKKWEMRRLSPSLSQPLGRNKYEDGNFTYEDIHDLETPAQDTIERHERTFRYLEGLANTEYGLAEKFYGPAQLKDKLLSRSEKLNLRDHLREYFVRQDIDGLARQQRHDSFAIHIVGSTGFLGMAVKGRSNLNLILTSLSEGDAYSDLAHSLSNSLIPGRLTNQTGSDVSAIRMGFDEDFYGISYQPDSLAALVQRHALGLDFERGILTAEVRTLTTDGTPHPSPSQFSDPLLGEAGINALLVLESEPGAAEKIQHRREQGLSTDEHREFTTEYLHDFVERQLSKRSSIGDGLDIEKTEKINIQPSIAVAYKTGFLPMHFIAIPGVLHVRLLEGAESKKINRHKDFIEIPRYHWDTDGAIDLKKLQAIGDGLGLDTSIFLIEPISTPWIHELPESPIPVIRRSVFQSLNGIQNFISRATAKLSGLEQDLLQKVLLALYA